MNHADKIYLLSNYLCERYDWDRAEAIFAAREIIDLIEPEQNIASATYSVDMTDPLR